MIKVQNVLNKSVEKEQEKYKGATPASPGAIQEVTKRSYLPWVILAVGAIAAAIYFFRQSKKGGGNEGIPS